LRFCWNARMFWPKHLFEPQSIIYSNKANPSDMLWGSKMGLSDVSRFEKRLNCFHGNTNKLN
jgi:hypothetical protein